MHSLYQRIQKLAQDIPETRKYLVPLIRRYARARVPQQVEKELLSTMLVWARKVGAWGASVQVSKGRRGIDVVFDDYYTDRNGKHPFVLTVTYGLDREGHPEIKFGDPRNRFKPDIAWSIDDDWTEALSWFRKQTRDLGRFTSILNSNDGKTIFPSPETSGPSPEALAYFPDPE